MGNTFKLGNYVNAIFQDASNNIGIGGSPSGSYKLEVTGTAKVSSTLLVSGAATFATDVTIGSPTTNATLSISGDNSGGDSFLNFKADLGAIKGQIQGTKNGANGGIIYFKTLQSSTLTTAMTIKEANVGIGTSSFYSKFAVKLSGATAPATVANTTGFDTTYVTFGNDTISGKQLGIGVSQTNQDGSYLISVAPASEWINLSLYAKDNIFYGNGTERLRISGTGTLTHNTGGVSSIVLGASANYTNISSGGYGATLYMNGATRGGTGGATSGCVVLATDAFFAVTDSSTNNSKFTVEGDGRTSIVSANSYVLTVTNSTNTSGRGVFVTALGSNNNNTSSYHYIATTGGADKYYLYGNGTYTTVSDERLKKNITKVTDTYLDKVLGLNIVNYNWNDQEDNSPLEFGMIAQDVEKVVPSIVHEGREQEDGNIYKGIQASVLPYILIKAIQELNQQNQDLKSRLDKAGL